MRRPVAADRSVSRNCTLSWDGNRGLVSTKGGIVLCSLRAQGMPWTWGEEGIVLNINNTCLCRLCCSNLIQQRNRKTKGAGEVLHTSEGMQDIFCSNAYGDKWPQIWYYVYVCQSKVQGSSKRRQLWINLLQWKTVPHLQTPPCQHEDVNHNGA